MARQISREFHPAVPVYVRRFFVAAGRHWNPGDVFDWQRLSVAQRRVKQLFDNGKLMHPAEGGVIAGPGEMPLVGETPSEQTVPATTAPSLETEMQDDAILAAAVEPIDELDDLDMKALREIAAAEDAPTRVSRAEQREAIRENRKAKAGA